VIFGVIGIGLFSVGIYYVIDDSKSGDGWTLFFSGLGLGLVSAFLFFISRLKGAWFDYFCVSSIISSMRNPR
jgi:hypothetical protein